MGHDESPSSSGSPSKRPRAKMERSSQTLTRTLARPSTGFPVTPASYIQGCLRASAASTGGNAIRRLLVDSRQPACADAWSICRASARWSPAVRRLARAVSTFKAVGRHPLETPAVTHKIWRPSIDRRGWPPDVSAKPKRREQAPSQACRLPLQKRRSQRLPRHGLPPRDKMGRNCRKLLLVHDL